MTRTRKCLGAALLLALFLTACDDHPEVGVTRTRVVANDDKRRKELDKTIADRFYSSPESTSTPEDEVADLLKWQVPATWEQLPSRPLRVINLRKGDVQCYVSVLTGGGAMSNINRWRGQMGQPPVGGKEIEALKAARLLGRDAHRVDLSGNYRGMSGTTAEDQRMVAMFAQFPRFAMSVKMLGPQAAVAAEIAAFDAFCASLEFDPSKLGGRGGPGAGHGGAGFDRSKLRWTAPEGWTKFQGHAMRHVAYRMAGDAKCSVTFLPGTAGGVAENVNRWLGQVGAAPLTPAAIRALPKIPVLGADCPLLVGLGEKRGVLATIARVPGESVFVKLEGPRAAVEKHKDGFIAFCKSLRVEE